MTSNNGVLTLVVITTSVEIDERDGSIREQATAGLS